MDQKLKLVRQAFHEFRNDECCVENIKEATKHNDTETDWFEIRETCDCIMAESLARLIEKLNKIKT